jgi:hypothetical protein
LLIPKDSANSFNRTCNKYNIPVPKLPKSDLDSTLFLRNTTCKYFVLNYQKNILSIDKSGKIMPKNKSDSGFSNGAIVDYTNLKIAYWILIW